MHRTGDRLLSAQEQRPQQAGRSAGQAHEQAACRHPRMTRETTVVAPGFLWASSCLVEIDQALQPPELLVRAL